MRSLKASTSCRRRSLRVAFSSSGQADFHHVAQTLVVEPGTRYRYNNSGYFLLGVIIEKITGKKYEHALQALVAIAAVVVFTDSGSTARRVARERPQTPLMVLTPSTRTARKVALLWGAHAVTTRDIGSFEEMVAKGKRMALRHGFGEAGSKLIMVAGVPFGVPGATNLLHVVTLTGDELKEH